MKVSTFHDVKKVLQSDFNALNIFQLAFEETSDRLFFFA